MSLRVTSVGIPSQIDNLPSGYTTALNSSAKHLTLLALPNSTLTKYFNKSFLKRFLNFADRPKQVQYFFSVNFYSVITLSK